MPRYYAVKVGRKPGIYQSWDQAERQVSGYSNAVYKAFSSYQEAQDFLTDKTSAIPQSDWKLATAYVDGSYSEGTGRYGYGGIVFLGSQRVDFYGGDSKEELVPMRNVAGELEAAQLAVQYSQKMGANHLDLYYDYMGIEKWPKEEWQANNSYTRSYRDYMQEKGKEIVISYHKVQAHTDVKYNEAADRLAKRGAQEGGFKEKYHA